MKLFCFFLVVVLFLQVFSETLSAGDSMQSYNSQAEGATVEILLKISKPQKINCSHACANRCSKASRKNVCSRACKTCCARCNCVPPGTYGNKQVCPCYAKLKTKGNKPKCP